MKTIDRLLEHLVNEGIYKRANHPKYCDRLLNLERNVSNYSVLVRLLSAYKLQNIYPHIRDKENFRNGLPKKNQWHKNFTLLKSLNNLLDWLKLDNPEVEEGEQNSPRWNDYSIALDSDPGPKTTIDLIKICNEIAPARCRLTRIFLRSNDTRKIRLSDGFTQLSKNILSNHSGQYDKGNQVWLSL